MAGLRFRLALTLAVGALSAVACSGSAEPENPGAASGAFPITVSHALGSTTVESEPDRVVALIDRDADTLLALGIEPVGVRSNFGFAEGVGPWATAALGDAQPEVWTGRELNYEQIAAADPDLIVFATSGGDAEEYSTLSKIAPTIPLPEGATPWSATLEETTTLIAEATGRTDQGREVLAELDRYLADTESAHPEFAGKTIAYFDLYDGGVFNYDVHNATNSTMYRLGFVPTEGSKSVPEGEGSITVSPELLADYDADIVLAYGFGKSREEVLAATPGLADLASVREGRFFLLEDLAFSNQSVLSVPYALDALVPRMSAAL